MVVSTMLAEIREIMWLQPCKSTCGLATYIKPWPCHVYITDRGLATSNRPSTIQRFSSWSSLLHKDHTIAM
ncbi:Uncharacterized protein TCM_028400 [Theobroma cacao]|uniref:Uncharacterized protein n=1 Tax=Theobroma cacao TaxID=3641 RepID=A0A061GAX7_THECC|nr:Uncharacterized protein TCM_028400 [Theobroma cacao]